MAKLLDGTRIYGTANVDTQVNIGANTYVNTSAFFITGNTTTAPSLSVLGTGLTAGNSTITGAPQLIVANSLGNATITTVSAKVGNATVFFIGNTTGIYSSGLVNIGNSTVNSTINSTAFTGAANNASFLGGTAAANFVQNTDSRTLSGNLVFAGANVFYTSGFYVNSIGTTSGIVVNNTVVAIGNSTVNVSINSTSFSGTANNALYIGGAPASQVINASGNFTLGGNLTFNGLLSVNNDITFTANAEATFNANVIISAPLYANGQQGSLGQVLTSNGAGVYWATPTGGGGGGGGGASVSVQAFPPGAPSVGDLWWNTNDANLKIYYFSNGAYQWVDASLGGTPTYNVNNNYQAVAFALVFGGF